MSPLRKSPHAEADARIRDLNAMVDDPEGHIALAVRLMEKSRHLEVVRAAVRVLGEAQNPDLRLALHRKFDWSEQQPVQRDGSGYIRAEIVRALQPIVQPEDLPLLQRAMTTYQMVGMALNCARQR